MPTWLKECEICNTGLCKEMRYLTDSVEKGGLGLPVREAAKRLEDQATKQIGEKVWSAEQIRRRYLYHTGKDQSGTKRTTPEKKAPHPQLEIKTDPRSSASDFAAMVISQLERIAKDDPRREEALDEVLTWLHKHRKIPVPSAVPSYQQDKAGFLQWLQRFHIEWCEATAIEMSTGWDAAHYLIEPESNLAEDAIQKTVLRIGCGKFEKLMKKYPKPIDPEIRKELANLKTDMDAFTIYIPVPDEVYEKVSAEEKKKSDVQGQKQESRSDHGGGAGTHLRCFCYPATIAPAAAGLSDTI